MERLYQPLLFLLARCSRNELIRQIEFLKAENELLRKRVPRKHIILKHAERDRLVALGRALGPVAAKLITIVNPETYLRWVRAVNEGRPKKRMGRPKTKAEIRELVVQIARETGWGYTRILGELRKQRIHSLSRQTVVNILKAEGLDPWPKRGPGTWDELLKMHAETLWQCDSFSKRMVTRRWIQQVFALIFLNVATRRVWISPSTCKTSEAWVEAQTKAFVAHVNEQGREAKLVTRDRDSKYRDTFDQVLKAQGVNVMRLSFRSPNLNAFVERFIQSVQQECLDHFLIFGEQHLDYLVREYVEHYHQERPHQSLGNVPLVGPPPPDEGQGGVLCRTRLGGLLKHYYREAA
jgi:putative transposase